MEYKGIELTTIDLFSNDGKATMNRLCDCLIDDLNKAARAKDAKKIQQLYNVSEEMNFDRTSDKWSNRYNKAIDKCNAVLYPI